MRFAMCIEYNGTAYCGWQSQPDGKTVQDHVQASLMRVADHPVTIQCAGRTDAGVHATWQIAHFDSSSVRTEREWLLGINTGMPKDINVSWVKPVADDFHARFGAVERSYRYIVLNREHRSALLHERVHFEPRMLDASTMHRAAQALVGEHDFSSFRAAGCQAKSPVRTVRSITVHRQSDFVVIDISANAFLQNMVRVITGSLLRVGRGDAEYTWPGQALKAKDRKHLGVTAPACGLYLTSVRYPSEYGLDCPEPRDEIFPFVTR